jgi:hypothetical protein
MDSEGQLLWRNRAAITTSVTTQQAARKQEGHYRHHYCGEGPHIYYTTKSVFFLALLQ